MATSKFIVKSDNREQLATVFLRVRHGREVDITVSTEFKVYPQYWNNKSQGFKRSIAFTPNFTKKDKNDLENEFLDLKNFILKKINSLSEDGATVNKEWLQTIIFEFHHPKLNQNKQVCLNEYIESFIQQIMCGERLTLKGQRYKKGTIKNYQGFQTQFNLYQKQHRKQLNYEHITIDFYDSYLSFFNKKNYSPNTIGRHIKNLKSIMRCAREEGVHNNTEIDRKKFKILKVAVSNIYLSELELTKILNLDLSQRPNLDKIRDIFLIGCYTAQRFSDYSRIQPENIRKINGGAEIIDLTQQKTGERVIIPIRPQLEVILKKYNYQLPKTHEQKVNTHIKEIAKIAGITELINIEEIKGGLKVQKKVPKCELIKTHTARRTGATNMYKAEIPTLAIMKITGHRTEKEFLNYIKITNEESAEALQSHPYFSNLKIVN